MTWRDCVSGSRHRLTFRSRLRHTFEAEDGGNWKSSNLTVLGQVSFTGGERERERERGRNRKGNWHTRKMLFDQSSRETRVITRRRLESCVHPFVSYGRITTNGQHTFEPCTIRSDDELFSSHLAFFCRATIILSFKRCWELFLLFIFLFLMAICFAFPANHTKSHTKLNAIWQYNQTQHRLIERKTKNIIISKFDLHSTERQRRI